MTGLEPRKKDVIPEILPPETGTTRVVRTVLVADVVESVRLMQEDEAGTVQRWRAFVDHVVHQLLPGQEGRLVKSLGDGLMLEFPRVNTAIGIAFAMQEAAAHANVDVAPERKLHLRIGIHVSARVADEHDIYGHGVNLAARLTTLAGPDEIVVSADVRDQLTPALDADIEDLGECYVKHVQQPVRAFRVGAPGEQPVIERGNLAEDLRATIAVIPFRPRALQPTDDVLGQLLADEVISALSRSPEVNVVSRLSTTAFQGREVKLDDVSAYLRADYVVSGSYHVDGDRVTLKAELAETRTMQVVWSQTLKGSVSGIVAGDDPLAESPRQSGLRRDDGARTAAFAGQGSAEPAESHPAPEQHHADAPHLAARVPACAAAAAGADRAHAAARLALRVDGEMACAARHAGLVRRRLRQMAKQRSTTPSERSIAMRRRRWQ